MDPSCGYNYYQQVNNYQLTSLDTFDNSTAYYNSMPMTSFESDLVYNHQAQHHQPAVTSTVSLSLSTHSSPGSYQPHQNDSYSPPAINLSSTPKGFDSPYSTNNYVNYYQTYSSEVNNCTDSAYQTMDFSNQHNVVSYQQRSNELDGSFSVRNVAVDCVNAGSSSSEGSTSSSSSLSSSSSRKRKSESNENSCELDNTGKSPEVNTNSESGDNATKRSIRQHAGSKRAKLTKITKLDYVDSSSSSSSSSNDSRNSALIAANAVNSNTLTYTCTNCLQIFSSLAKYLMHKHKVHSNGSSTQCPVCLKKFGSQANTLVHMRAHTQEKTYRCKFCEQSFCDSSTLKKHLRTHTGERPYECDICWRKFSQSGNLKRHLEVHRKYDAVVEEASSSSMVGTTLNHQIQDTKASMNVYLNQAKIEHNTSEPLSIILDPTMFKSDNNFNESPIYSASNTHVSSLLDHGSSEITNNTGVVELNDAVIGDYLLGDQLDASAFSLINKTEAFNVGDFLY